MSHLNGSIGAALKGVPLRGYIENTATSARRSCPVAFFSLHCWLVATVPFSRSADFGLRCHLHASLETNISMPTLGVGARPQAFACANKIISCVHVASLNQGITASVDRVKAIINDIINNLDFNLLLDIVKRSLDWRTYIDLTPSPRGEEGQQKVDPSSAVRRALLHVDTGVNILFEINDQCVLLLLIVVHRNAGA